MSRRSPSPSCKANLIEHAEKARLSRELVRLICDAPLPEPLDALAMKGIPEEPLREFLDHHGFRSLLARLGAQSQAGRADATERPTQAEVRPEPKIDRSLYETVTDEAALDRWIAEASANGPGRVRHRDRRARLRHAPSWSGSASPPTATRPATSRSNMAATTCSPSGPSSLPPTLVLGEAEAAARGSGDPQDRPQSQVRLGRARPARHRRRAL